MRMWRLAREPFCRDREGTGAFLAGGRWTPPGTRVLHAASSIALAGLEYLVHARKPPADLVLVAIDLPGEAAIERPMLDELPADWANPLPSEDCQAWGRSWCEAARALALAVPSVIVPEERELRDQRRTFADGRRGAQDHSALFLRSAPAPMKRKKGWVTGPFHF